MTEFQQPTPEGAEPDYARWGQRFGAWLLDLLIIYGVLIVLALIVYAIVGPDNDPSTDDSAAYGAIAGIAGLVIMPFYFGFLHGRQRGQSVGKRMIGIAVRRAETFDRLGYRRSFARSLVTLAFWIVPTAAARVLGYFAGATWLLDYLWPIWDRRRQALHDKVVASVVIRPRA
jgi:uncharacterized RDD family membrane protein YckC